MRFWKLSLYSDRKPRGILRQSNKDSSADMGFFDAREFTVEATERGRETLVVDAQDVEHRGVEDAEVDRVFGDVIAAVVSAGEFDAYTMTLPENVGLMERSFIGNNAGL